MADAGDDELQRLRAENARLIALLKSNKIAWHSPSQAAPERLATEKAALSLEQKVALFRRLFRGREDVYALRWESRAGKSGYAPACANEWRAGVCEKPRIKCSDCGNRQFLQLSDQVMYGHLAGQYTVGVYPLLSDESCYFLAVDFDEADWREDARAFVRSCRELDIPVALEISRSGNGAHAWIFFASAVAARDARRLGSAIVSYTCARTHQLELSSYDRFFPNQDTMPKGGMGNLIALPLQKKPREQGFSVFADDDLQPYRDQWAFLGSVRPLSADAVGEAVFRASGGGHPLDVAFLSNEEDQEPWRRPASTPSRLPGIMPKSITLTLANLIYFEKDQLPQPLANRLIRLAAFQNPEFYRAQAMRFPVWDKPRVIGCAENFPRHIALPRGCLDDVLSLLRDNGIEADLRDQRFDGKPLDVRFKGLLRDDQEAAVSDLLRHDVGVLCAPTAFGKTVTAAAMIARRRRNTLVLVHRVELLRQWQDRLRTFLGLGNDAVGTVGGGRARLTGRIDIAVMQSVSRQGQVHELVENYGHVVVDECHHLSAFSFEAILKRVRAKHVLGLTATPLRRDGHDPIIFMQCGPIRHIAKGPSKAPHVLEVVPRFIRSASELLPDSAIQAVFRQLAADQPRTQVIATDILALYREGRKILVLTERTEHLDAIRVTLSEAVNDVFVLHGRMSRKQRSEVISGLQELPAEAPRVLLSTGRLIGEGFDHPPLDTLVLAMPISWKGTLQQYAGRLHREHVGKVDVRIYDYVDDGHPALMRMWEKRQRGYRSMGYCVMDRGQAQSLI